MLRILRTIAVVTLAALTLASCGGDDDTDDATEVTAATTSTTAATTSNGQAATLTVVASEVKFDKASLTAKAAQPLTITLQNNDLVEHNITIEDLDVDEDAAPNATATTDTLTPEAGTYEYHCEYHPTAMRGTLLVS